MKNFYKYEGLTETRRSRRKGEVRFPRRGEKEKGDPIQCSKAQRCSRFNTVNQLVPAAIALEK